jgi:L-rhamnose-H+ transport protein
MTVHDMTGLTYLLLNLFTATTKIRLRMQVLSGIIYHFIGGFASGSFYIPYKKVRGWPGKATGSLAGCFPGCLFLS